MLTGAPEQLTASERPKSPYAISPDGQRLLLAENTGKGNDLSVLRMDGKSMPETLVPLSIGENNAELSPDGRWLAYQSRESSANVIDVRPFPNANAGRWQVTSSGSKPKWATSGRELFYLDDGLLTSVAVQTAPSFIPATQENSRDAIFQ